MRWIPLAVFLFSVIVVLTSMSCARNRRTQVEFRLSKCKDATGMDPDTHSYGVLLYALGEREWLILDRDFEKKTIRAKKCHARDVNYCAMISFTVDKYGSVRASSSPGTAVRGNLLDEFARWRVDLTQSFNEAKCGDEELLEEAFGKAGISLDEQSAETVEPSDTVEDE